MIKRIVWAAGAALALAMAAAAPASALSVPEARHLLGRAGFGQPSGEELRPYLGMSREQAVDSLLRGLRTEASTPLPRWSAEAPPDRRAVRDNPDMRRQLQEQLRERAFEAKGWWMNEMLATESPFTERLVLFWHNHFTSDLRKARWAPLMLRQNALLRRNAAGNYQTFLREITADPAMVLYLDSHTNRRGSPNENYARELLELFTLGEGNYTEQDIKEAARALTGFRVDRDSGGVVFDQRLFDPGQKTFLGRTGAFGAGEIIALILHQPRAAEWVTEKMWREFVSPSPDPAEIKRLAAVFRQGGYEIRPLLRAMFLSPAFWDERNRGSLVKSPVDLVVGTLRFAGVRSLPDGRQVVQALRGMGQDLMDPPNVKGWPGGEHWITGSTLVVREQLLTRLSRGQEDVGMEAPFGGGRRMAMAGGGGMMPGDGGNALDAIPPQMLLQAMLAVPPIEPPEPGVSGQALLRHLLLDPAYQVK